MDNFVDDVLYVQRWIGGRFWGMVMRAPSLTQWMAWGFTVLIGATAGGAAATLTRAILGAH